jgi:hypothetical protein
MKCSSALLLYSKVEFLKLLAFPGISVQLCNFDWFKVYVGSFSGTGLNLNGLKYKIFFHQRTIEGVTRTVASGLVLGFLFLRALLLFALTLLFGLSAVALPGPSV